MGSVGHVLQSISRKQFSTLNTTQPNLLVVGDAVPSHRKLAETESGQYCVTVRNCTVDEIGRW